MPDLGQTRLSRLDCHENSRSGPGPKLNCIDIFPHWMSRVRILMLINTDQTWSSRKFSNIYHPSCSLKKDTGFLFWRKLYTLNILLSFDFIIWRRCLIFYWKKDNIVPDTGKFLGLNSAWINVFCCVIFEVLTIFAISPWRLLWIMHRTLIHQHIWVSMYSYS